MEFSATKTYANLMAAFAGESQARNKYTYYASKAKSSGYEQISAFFTETADNERAHAEIWFRLLHKDDSSDTRATLLDAADGEWYEYSEMYRKFAEEAKAEGYNEIASLFSMVGDIENRHYERFKKLAENIEKGIVFKRDGVTLWKCRNCGNIHAAESAPQICPVCKKAQSYYEIKEENY